MSQWVERVIASEIKEAIAAEDKSTYVFYITGTGGEGKTILLRQIGMMLGSQDGIAAHFPWSGILDLYDSSVNSSMGLESRLRKALETTGEFEIYDQEQGRYRDQLASGFTGSYLESARQDLAEAFSRCVNAVTLWSRVVIAMDTTERIQYEVDEVQKLCKLEDESTTVRTWLVNQLRSWRNCVVLLVGRPEAEPYLGKALAKALSSHPNVHYIEKTLGPFSEYESQEYFRRKESDYPVVCSFDPDFSHRLWQVTEGRAIRLDLVLELIQNHKLGFDRLRRRIEEEDPEETRIEIDRLLVDIIMRGDLSDWMRDTLLYLAVARRGLGVALLGYLEKEWDLKKCEMRLEAATDRPFVKRHPEDGRLFLHDEMYQLCDTYLLKPETTQRLSARIVEWYDQQLVDIESRGDLSRKATIETQNLQVDSLLYRLRANPYQGYHWYAQQAEWAIRSSEMSFDMRLRNEILSFLHSASPIDQRLLHDAPELTQEVNSDSAARWVKRHMSRGDNEQAIYVAQRVSESQLIPPTADDTGLVLAQADLNVYYAQALIYTGQATEGITLLRDTITELEKGHRADELALTEPDTYGGWRRNLVLGRAHNNLGYAEWMESGHLRAALEHFRAALPYFRASRLLEELANTNDNMGRVYAMLRYRSEAEALVDEGLRIRQELGREYRLGLSLNSRAIVYLEFGDPQSASLLCEHASLVFDRVGSLRGKGLVMITWGRALRHQGRLWVERLYDENKSNDSFVKGALYLGKAIEIFEKDVREPVRLVEAYNELGSLYRDRYGLAQRKESEARPSEVIADIAAQKDKSDRKSQILANAERYLTRSIQLAGDHELTTWYIDSCEDLAETYYLCHDYDSARAWAERAQRCIPDEYKLIEGVSVERIPPELCVDEFWLQMGKIELLLGNLVFDLETDERTTTPTRQTVMNMLEHYLLSISYFERYSELAVDRNSAFQQMYERLKTFSPDDWRHLEHNLSTIAGKYDIDPGSVGGFLKRTMGLEINRTW